MRVQWTAETCENWGSRVHSASSRTEHDMWNSYSHYGLPASFRLEISSVSRSLSGQKLLVCTTYDANPNLSSNCSLDTEYECSFAAVDTSMLATVILMDIGMAADVYGYLQRGRMGQCRSSCSGSRLWSVLRSDLFPKCSMSDRQERKEMHVSSAIGVPLLHDTSAKFCTVT